MRNDFLCFYTKVFSVAFNLQKYKNASLGLYIFRILYETPKSTASLATLIMHARNYP